MQKNEITREMKQFDVTIVLLTVKEKKEEGESEEAVEKNVKEKAQLNKALEEVRENLRLSEEREAEWKQQISRLQEEVEQGKNISVEEWLIIVLIGFIKIFLFM